MCKMQNFKTGRANGVADINERYFTRFEFKMSFEGIVYMR